MSILKSKILSPIYSYKIWTRLAIHDLKQRYRRSVLGSLWYSLNIIFLLFTIGFIFSHITRANFSTVIPYILIGLVVWSYISTSITESINVYIESFSLIKNHNLDATNYVYKVWFKNILIFGHNLPIAYIVLFIFDYKLHFSISLVLGIIIIFLNILVLSLFISILSSRFRDIPPATLNLLQILFFVTPVFWDKKLLANYGDFLNLNPFFHYIEIIRSPILSDTVPYLSLLISTLIFAFFFFINFFLYKYKYKKIVYWI